MNGTVGTLTIEMAANIVRLQQDMDKAKKTVDSAMGSVEKSIDRVTTAIGAIASALSVQAFTTKLIQVQREFDILNSSLITVTGSSRNAEIEFAWIKNFAATTPFSLAEVTSAFIKMKALGLDASAEALSSYGNTASAMGKSLNDLIEAIADAATGEFERLKEFGIKANAEGDRVTLTFRGVSTNIGKNAAEITQYLRSIGEFDFAGAMENRANTLDGAISNLSDTWDELFRTINKGLFGDLLLDSVRGLTSLLSGLAGGITTLGDAIERNKTQLMIWGAIFTGGALLAALPLITAAVGALTTGVIALSAAFAANPVALAIMAVTAAAVPAVNAISAMVAENKKAEAATKQVYETEVQRAAFLEANASPAQEKQIALTKEQIKEIEKQEEAYKKLIEKLREQNAELLLEEANNGKLSSQQKQALNVMLEIQNGTLKLTETRKREIVEILNANIALEAEAKKRDDAKKAVEEQDKAYAKIIDAIRSNIAASSEQTGSLATLSDSQSNALKILTQYSDELVNMTDDRKLEIAAMLEQMIAEGDLADAYKKSDAALAAYKKTRESQSTELTKGTTALESEIAKQAEANKTYGLSKRAIGELEIAKLKEKAASMDRASQLALEADFDAESAEQYRLQAERLRELASLKQEGVHIQIAKDSADEWKKTTDELSKGLTDALMRGFESGKGFFENLLGVLKNRFMSFVAESIIKPFMDGIAGGMTALTAPITAAVRSVVNSIMTSIGLGGTAGGTAGGAAGGAAAGGGGAVGGAVAAGGAGGAGAAIAGGGAPIVAGTAIPAAEIIAASEASLIAAEAGILGSTVGATGAAAATGLEASLIAAEAGILGSTVGSTAGATLTASQAAAATTAGEAIAAAEIAGSATATATIAEIAATAGPYALAVLAAYIAYKTLKGGETRKGGRYIYNHATGAKLLVSPSGGEIAGTVVSERINAMVEGLNNIGAPYGKKIYEIYAGLESSSTGKGGTFLGGRWNDGTRFGDVVPGDNPGAWQFNQSLTAAQALSQFAQEIDFAQRDAQHVLMGVARPTNNPGGSSGKGGSTLDSSGGKVTGLATGTNFVPQDMLAMIHKGEAIVPKQYNPAVGGENVVAAEIRSLRDEVVQLRAEARSTAINSAKMARLQDNWDVRGLIVRTDVDQPLETVAA